MSTEDNPVVDVTVAVHSATRPISRAVASVLENETPLRVTVVAHNIDPEIIRANLGELALDPRVHQLSLHDGIPSPAGPMNLGFGASETEFFSVIGSDDALAAGAVDSWVALAQSAEADAVLARVQHVGGPAEPTPPVRPGRTADLDPIKDRLAYRSAPLGLLRRSAFGHLRFPVGLRSGEDLPFVTRMWFSDRKIALDLHGPAYLVHPDAEDRVTADPRPIAKDFEFLDYILDTEWGNSLSVAARRAIAVKLLRVHVFDAIVNRRYIEVWARDEREQFSAVAKRLISWGAHPERFLSVRDRAALDAVLNPHAPDALLTRLGERRAQYAHPLSVVTRNPFQTFARQAPLRTLFAGWLLSRS